jgi:hypothetical protein
LSLLTVQHLIFQIDGAPTDVLVMLLAAGSVVAVAAAGAVELPEGEEVDAQAICVVGMQR